MARDPSPRSSAIAGTDRARVLAAAAAHRRVKRALGLLRAAANALAPELADVDVVGELRVSSAADVEALVELIDLARVRAGGRELDVVVLSIPPEPGAASHA